MYLNVYNHTTGKKRTIRERTYDGPVVVQNVVNLFDGQLERFPGEFVNLGVFSAKSGTEYVQEWRKKRAARHEAVKTTKRVRKVRKSSPVLRRDSVSITGELRGGAESLELPLNGGL